MPDGHQGSHHDRRNRLPVQFIGTQADGETITQLRCPNGSANNRASDDLAGERAEPGLVRAASDHALRRAGRMALGGDIN